MLRNGMGPRERRSAHNQPTRERRGLHSSIHLINQPNSSLHSINFHLIEGKSWIVWLLVFFDEGKTSLAAQQHKKRRRAALPFNSIPFLHHAQRVKRNGVDWRACRADEISLVRRLQREVAAELLSLISLNSIKSFNSCLLSAALSLFCFCLIEFH